MLHPGCSVDPNRGTRGVVPATRLGRAVRAAGLSVFSDARTSDPDPCLEEGGGRAPSLLLYCLPSGGGGRENVVWPELKSGVPKIVMLSITDREPGAGCSGGICRKTAEATLPSFRPAGPASSWACLCFEGE